MQEKWDYLFICAEQVNHIWRPRFSNSQEIANWPKGPTIDAYTRLLGEQGWELVAINRTMGALPIYELVFKRPIP